MHLKIVEQECTIDEHRQEPTPVTPRVPWADSVYQAEPQQELCRVAHPR